MMTDLEIIEEELRILRFQKSATGKKLEGDAKDLTLKERYQPYQPLEGEIAYTLEEWRKIHGRRW
jgi:hypothetical protein